MKEKAYPTLLNLSEAELQQKAQELRDFMEKRRSCRYFSDRPVPQEVIAELLKVASSAPSGANKQPWTFCAISDPELKEKIRIAAEKEEKAFYESRAPKGWLKDLEPLGTTWEKPFLSTAPWLIIMFKQSYGLDEAHEKTKHYYVNESVGIAAGFLISAIHQLGLVTLTHTPSPMDFLTKILGRPSNEKPFLLLPVGFPAKDATVPDIRKKGLDEVVKWY